MEVKEGINETKEVVEEPKVKRGTFDDLMRVRDDIEELPVTWLDIEHIVKVKTLGWEAYNKIVLATLKELGADAHPSAYERRKQEQMIRLMVVEIDGHVLNEADWIRIPAPFAETIRVAIFTNTAELTEMYKEQGMSLALIKELMSQMNLGDKTITDREGEVLKNLESRSRSILPG